MVFLYKPYLIIISVTFARFSVSLAKPIGGSKVLEQVLYYENVIHASSLNHLEPKDLNRTLLPAKEVKLCITMGVKILFGGGGGPALSQESQDLYSGPAS